jgi:hypothetical protein
MEIEAAGATRLFLKIADEGNDMSRTLTPAAAYSPSAAEIAAAPIATHAISFTIDAP